MHHRPSAAASASAGHLSLRGSPRGGRADRAPRHHATVLSQLQSPGVRFLRPISSSLTLTRKRDDWRALGIRYTCARCYHDLGPDPPFVYSFCLTLADNVVPTQAWLHALVWKEDGVCLLCCVEAVLSLLQERFLGLPAVNLYNNEARPGSSPDQAEGLAGRRSYDRLLPSIVSRDQQRHALSPVRDVILV